MEMQEWVSFGNLWIYKIYLIAFVSKKYLIKYYKCHTVHSLTDAHLLKF